MPGFLLDLWNVLLMVIGFSLVIVVHELGHFLAARWAGIRVHTFAVGFGQAVCSWRKGLGFRVGSSEPEYNTIVERESEGIQESGADPAKISPTEYRLNWFLFGGYVRMLGQEDAAPQKTSDAPDSYTSKPVWKRMIVISGGVIMNVVLAAVLFMIVFLAGMREVPPVVGEVRPGSPAALAGFLPGDVVLEVGDGRAETFTDISIASAMSGPDETVRFRVLRAGERLTLRATPEKDASGLKTVGIAPPLSTTLREPERPGQHDALVTQFERAGLRGVEPGMAIIAIDGEPIEPLDVPGEENDPLLLDALRDAAVASDGTPIPVTFRAPESGRTVETTIRPAPEYQDATTTLGESAFPFGHLLGLTPLMKVLETQPRGAKQGLRAGDVFLRIADVDAPSVPEAIATIRDHAGGMIPLRILRDGERIRMAATVSEEGIIGFAPDEAFGTPVVARTPSLRAGEGEDAEAPGPLPSSRIEPALPPGSRIVSIDAVPVETFDDIHDALRRVTREAHGAGSAATVSIAARDVYEPDAEPSTHTWTLTPAEVEALHALGYRLDPLLEAQFQFATIVVQASNPWQGVVMGVQKTNRIMMLTYLTFQRLVQGTVSPEELRGPVGITHIGSQYAAQGFVYFLFFLALISANLAVINFLPIPVVDGGHFLMLLYEGVTRRPVPMVVQNVATAVGLALILTAFIYVTINDISRLF